MATKERSESLEVNISLGNGCGTGLMGVDSPEKVAKVEKRVIELARRHPDLPIKIVRRELGDSKTIGFSHISEEDWDAIFKKGKMGKA